jgi:glutathione-regulated potassium-efflux system ancillary protein KefF
MRVVGQLNGVPAIGGGDETGKHAHPFQSFIPVVEQTARFCAMNWLEPFTVHGAHKIGDAALAEQGQRYRERLLSWSAEHGSS